jgi:hypothetical protein
MTRDYQCLVLLNAARIFAQYWPAKARLKLQNRESFGCRSV